MIEAMAKGRKHNLENVVPLKSEDGVSIDERCIALAADLKPVDLTALEGEIWDRLAPQLARLDRLKPHFVDVIAEYCRIMIRMKKLRKILEEKKEVYAVDGRNGEQLKSRPEVAQLNQTWSNWRNLTAALGLTPTDERGLAAGQGDLFPESNPFAQNANLS